MAWQTPKTNWAAGNVPAASDFNRIEGNIQELQDTKETPAGAQAKVDTHVSDDMPHRTTDPTTGKVYHWGLAVQNGEWGIIYEEVV